MPCCNSSNPLINPLIVYEILCKLPRSDVLNCRLVCGTWDTEVCRLLRKTFTLDFHDLCQAHRFHCLLDDATEVNVKGGRDRDIPFAKLHLRASFRLGHSLAQEFFKTHGHIIRHLTILKVGCDCGANFFQKLLFYQAVNLSSLNLQIISSPIRLSPESGYQYHHSGSLRPLQFPNTSRSASASLSVPGSGPGVLKLPMLTHLHLRHQLFLERSNFIKELLNATHNLQSLTSDAGSPEFCSGVFLPMVLNSTNKWTKLRKLHCGDSLTLTEFQIEQICSKNIYLEELHMHFNHPNFDPIPKESIHALLKWLSRDLKRLELNNRQTDVSFELDWLPRMFKLESLRLVNIAMEPKWLGVGTMPRLQTFEFIEEDRSGICIPLGNIGTFSSGPRPLHPSISRLSLSPMCILNIADMNDMSLWWDVNGSFYIRRIAQAFPNLKGFSLNGNDAILRGIYTELSQLEELSIHGLISDEGITGIPLQICEMMHVEQSYDIKLDGIQTGKYIGDLTRLRKLVIVAPVKCSLTEVSIFFGIICCKDLFDLDLTNPELMKLWKEETMKYEETKPS